MAKGKKTGGRQKGALNVRTTSVIEQMAGRDFDPIDMLIDIAIKAESDGDKYLTFQTCKELAQYIVPKRKAMEITGEIKSNVELNELTDLQRANLKKLL